MPDLPLLALPTLVSALFGAGLARALWRRPRVSGARTLAGVALLVAVWSLAHAAQLTFPAVAVKVQLLKVVYAAVLALAALWLVMVLEVVVPPPRLSSRQRVGILLATLVLTGTTLAATNELHGLVWTNARLVSTGGGTMVTIDWGPAFYALIGFAYACVVIGAGILAVALAIGSPVLRRRAIHVVAGSLAPVVINLLFLLRLPPFSNYDATPLAALLAVAIWAHGLLGARLPALAPLVRDRVFHAIGDAVVVVDADGRIADLNPAATRLLAGAGAKLGVRVAAVLPADGWRRILAAAPQPTSLALAIAPEIRNFEARLEVLPGADATPLGWLLLLRDATEAIRANEARLRLGRMEGAVALVAGTAHRVDALLETIRQHAADAAALDANVAKCLDGIVATAARGDDLVEQMLRFSRDFSIEPRPVGLGALVERVVSTEKSTFPPAIEVKCTVAASSLEVLGDRDALEQLFASLLHNAREAIAATGHIEIEVDRVHVGMGSTWEGGVRLSPGTYVRTVVRDDGAGMEPATADRMFEPFFSTKARGRGLELAVGHATVLGHRGVLAVETEPGRGTAVAVFLPAITPRGRIRDIGVPRSEPGRASERLLGARTAA